MEIKRLKEYSLQDLSLRDYQQENKQKIYDAWEQVDSVMLQMPTGTGKTRLFVSIINDLIRYGQDTNDEKRVLILTHRTELVAQVDKELTSRYHLEHGVIQSGRISNKEKPIQLASVQTLARRLNDWKYEMFDLVVIDEAHHVTADSYQKIINAFPEAKLLGVTATPVRLNGQGFTETFDELIASPSVQEFINHGYLSRYDYYSVGRSSYIQRQIDGIKKFSQGDYAESELERVCDNDRIRAQVVDTYIQYANGKKGIVYTVNKEHNNHLCGQFNSNGIKAVAIDSDTPQEVRAQYIEEFKRGDITVICNVNLFTEGFDCPDIEFIQLARPTKSLALFLQQVGRGLRIAEAKSKTVFLDNVGLYNRFSFPSSKRKWKYHFEGKYEGNKMEGEDEPTLNCFVMKSGAMRPNLEEGHEQVHLIQTTFDKQYLEERASLLYAWIEPYIKMNVEAINKIYDELYIKGMGLHFDFQHMNYGKVDMYDVFHLYVNERTTELRRESIRRKFYFFEFDGDKIANQEHRTSRTLNEFIEQLDNEFHNRRRDYIRQTVKDRVQIFKRLSFTEGEIYDVLDYLMREGLGTDDVPSALGKPLVGIWGYLLLFWGDTFYIIKKSPESLNWIEHATIAALRNNRSTDSYTIIKPNRAKIVEFDKQEDPRLMDSLELAEKAKMELRQYGKALIRRLDAIKHAIPIGEKKNVREVSLPQPIASLACSGLLETIESIYIGNWKPGEVLLIYATEDTAETREQLENDIELYSKYYNALMFGNLSQTVTINAYVGFVKLGSNASNRNHKRYVEIIGSEILDTPNEEKPTNIANCKTHVAMYKNITIKGDTITIPLSSMAWEELETEKFISFYWEKKYEGLTISPEYYEFLFCTDKTRKRYLGMASIDVNSIDDEGYVDEYAGNVVFRGTDKNGVAYLCFDLSKMTEVSI